jgi:predicted AlkP superfamily phosphohydrolase/phosphomutase
MALHPTVIIELDGADWHVMKPLLAAGRLPNIKRLMDEGSSGDLVSSPPLISPRLWVSIHSGKTSKEHGIEFFGSATSMVKVRRVWDILEERGRTVGVLGSFVTWPPYPVRGFMIPTLFALGPETHPPEYSFYQELTLRERKKGKPGMFGAEARPRSMLWYGGQLLSHGVRLASLARAGMQLVAGRLRPRDADGRYWRRAAVHLDVTTDLLVHLIKRYRPDFVTYHIHLCDAFAHRYWKYYEPGAFGSVDPAAVRRYGDVIPRGYVEADRTVGRLRKARPEANILLVSDHGTMAMESVRNSYRLSIETFLKLIAVPHDVIPANVGLMTFLYYPTPERMVEARSYLQSIKFRDDGKPVFDVFNEEALLGLRLTNDLWGQEVAADRVIDLGPHGTVKFGEIFLEQRMEVSGTHRLEGVAILAGPDLRRGVALEGASIFDVTPTVLALAGLPVAEDMQGKVWQQSIKPEFLAEHPLGRIPTYETGAGPGARGGDGAAGAEASEKVKSRLRSLGYL